MHLTFFGDWYLKLYSGRHLKFKRECGFLHDFELFLPKSQGWPNQGLIDGFLSTFSKVIFENGFSYPFER